MANNDKNRSEFWRLLEESVIFQGILVIMIAGTVCGMYLMGREVPALLAALLGTIVTYFFEQKRSVQQTKANIEELTNLKAKLAEAREDG